MLQLHIRAPLWMIDWLQDLTCWTPLWVLSCGSDYTPLQWLHTTRLCFSRYKLLKEINLRRDSSEEELIESGHLRCTKCKPWSLVWKIKPKLRKLLSKENCHWWCNHLQWRDNQFSHKRFLDGWPVDVDPVIRRGNKAGGPAHWPPIMGRVSFDQVHYNSWKVLAQLPPEDILGTDVNSMIFTQRIMYIKKYLTPYAASWMYFLDFT